MCDGSPDEHAISSFIGSVAEECSRFWQAGVETNTVSQMSEADRVCECLGRSTGRAWRRAGASAGLAV